ncbi:Oidioi.mRNA.OKI2018_I69.chr1.g3789.t1.cds [Oikopleura dioica]|uniref:Oidioi.mRNA.OKI2018_I69.chr1.g3789.t1.cds n=1 Tax=Oikopleura dioica TaxID=34765 RepID=A0ABN7T227_OIKDI|nr:Oidioi.mRNA.OKI2018_I69.chr1.g3789.t1.cds [Oikopleura dioica]
MKEKLSLKKQESSEDPSSVPLNVVVNVNQQINNETKKEDKKDKKDKKSCMNKVKGLSLVLKIAVALLTIHGIVTPLILSKMSPHSDSQDNSTNAAASEIDEVKAESEKCYGREKNSLMVLTGYGSKTEYLSYVLKPDGSESPRTIKMPSSIDSSQFLYASISAMIRGKVFIFGKLSGSDYGLRIRMISGCEIKELDVKLNNRYYFGSSVVTAADQQSAMICFPDDEKFKKCEEFDGSAVSIKPSTKYSHRSSCLALYNDQPVAVSSGLPEGRKKVEKFDGVSWTEMEDFPKPIYIHSCIGVFDGYLLLGGNYEENDKYYNSKDVYLLRDSRWTVVGQLNKYHWYSSATRIRNTIYLVSGKKEPYAVEKLEWDGEEISSAKVINNHSNPFWRPIIFPVDEFYCT